MNYYFLGIGGIGMSALARYLVLQGHCVSGYDRTASEITDGLMAIGIPIHFTDSVEMIPDNIDLVVYTPAVPSSLGEYRYLADKGIPFVKRSLFLAQITSDMKVVAVGGSHGKTTTSTLIAHILHEAKTSVSAFLGGISNNLGSNLLDGGLSEYAVVEADEYDRSFLKLFPHIAVVTSTDPDHLDIYGTHHNLLLAYEQFISQVSSEGLVLLNKDAFNNQDKEAGTNEVIVPRHPNLLTYHFDSKEADYYAYNITSNTFGDISFSIHTPTTDYHDLTLCQSPLVNVGNAVAAVAVALNLGLSIEQIRPALLSFRGVHRRFEYHINTSTLTLIDDYAHHPQEIAQTLRSLRYLYPDHHITAIFQPHLYSRTRDFADQFADVLSKYDRVILLPIYPAREMPIEGVSSEMLLNRLALRDKHLLSKEELLQVLRTMNEDIVLTIGAGDISTMVPTIKQILLTK